MIKEHTVEEPAQSGNGTDELWQRASPEPKLQELIKYVTIQEGVDPVGSAGFRAIKYPADIDIFERIDRRLCVDGEADLAGHEKEFADWVAMRLKLIVQTILISEEIFFVELKAGLDDRFEIPDDRIGDLDYVADRCETWRACGLVSEEEYADMTEQMRQIEATSDEDGKRDLLQRFVKSVREYKICRWNATEILNGEKQLRKGKVLALPTALLKPTITKLDTLMWYDDRYIESTNFFYMSITINESTTLLSMPFGNYEETLRNAIVEYRERDIIKAVKKCHLLTYYLHKTDPDNEVLQRQLRDEAREYLRIINGSGGRLTQIKADFEALTTVTRLFDPDTYIHNHLLVGNLLRMLLDMEKRFLNSVDLDRYQNEIGEFQQLKDKLFFGYIDLTANSNDAQLVRELLDIIGRACEYWENKLSSLINELVEEQIGAIRLTHPTILGSG